MNNAVTTFAAPRTFRTMFNGAYPFQVDVDRNQVRISALVDGTDDQYQELRTFTFMEFFVGRSPVTKMSSYSGGHGPRFDGNSVLFLKDISIKDKDTTFEYVWVGSLYGTFRVPNKIVFYQSEVGNNDVPYPWAVDDQTNVIFFIGDERKDGLSLLRNSPPQLDLQKVLANQQDFMQLADPKNEDSVRSAKILNKERALYKTPEMYDFFWHVLGGHRRRGKRSKLYEGVMSHIKLENVLNLFERRLNRASRKKR